MVFQLENCCLCMDLRTGSVIIGYLTLVRDIILTILALIAMQTIWVYAAFNAITSIILIFGIISINFNIVFLIGLHEEKSKFVGAYLIYNTVVLAIAMLLTVLFGIVIELPVLIPLIFFFLSFHVYYLLVVRSYYLKMNNPLQKSAIFHTPEGPPLTAAQIA